MSPAKRSSQSPAPEQDQASSQERPQPVDLKGRYSKIGISAVAAAVRFKASPDKAEASSTTPDRSTARGWSRHA